MAEQSVMRRLANRWTTRWVTSDTTISDDSVLSTGTTFMSTSSASTSTPDAKQTSRLPPASGDENFSVSNFTVPPRFLDSVIPGYGLFSDTLKQLFGFDITAVVSICFMLFTLCRGAYFLLAQVRCYVEGVGTSEVIIEDDGIEPWVIRYLQRRGIWSNARTLYARQATSYMHSCCDSCGLDQDAHSATEANKEASIISTVRFQPLVKVQYFWYRWRLFRITLDNGTEDLYKDTATIRLACLGRSPSPIKALIAEAEREQLMLQGRLVSIKRPTGMKGESPHVWFNDGSKPARSIETITLNQGDKEDLVSDIEHYLLPSTAQWYSSRGIPWRRGYLLHGPAGTGKSSLAFTLAGHFSLDLYTLSLQDPMLTDDSLSILFGKLPERCVVLLEDIDQAGMRRDKATDPENDASTKQTKPGKLKATASSGSKISLSGLLNVVDGAASSEGRVLIMTTSRREALARAWMRPGRVDVEVSFPLLTKEQAYNLFLRIFQPMKRPTRTSDGATPEQTIGANVDPQEIADLATRFADLCPEETFSPAEIQGFLLFCKSSPSLAVDHFPTWRDKKLKKIMEESRLLVVTIDNGR